MLIEDFPQQLDRRGKWDFWGRQLLLSDLELIWPPGIPSTTGHRAAAREMELKAANPVQGLRNWEEESGFLSTALHP